jgi:hypothetical protein
MFIDDATISHPAYSENGNEIVRILTTELFADMHSVIVPEIAVAAANTRIMADARIWFLVKKKVHAPESVHEMSINTFDSRLAT